MEGTSHQRGEAGRLQSCRYESPHFLPADFDRGVQEFEGSCEPQGRQQRIITAEQSLLIITTYTEINIAQEAQFQTESD